MSTNRCIPRNVTKFDTKITKIRKRAPESAAMDAIVKMNMVAPITLCDRQKFSRKLSIARGRGPLRECSAVSLWQHFQLAF